MLASALCILILQAQSGSELDDLKRRLAEQDARLKALEQVQPPKDRKPEDDDHRLWSSPPDGKPSRHRETPWVDGDRSFFTYLMAPEHAPVQDSDLPTGLYYGSKSSFAEFHGFAHFEYYDLEDQGPRDGDRIMEVHHFYLSARAEVAANLRAFLEVEYEHGNENTIIVDRAMIEWALARELSLQLGQRFAPFGIEKQLTALAPMKNTITNPVIIDAFEHGDWPMVGVFATGMIDLPLAKGSMLDYTVGAIGGETGLARGESSALRDNNDDKTAILNLGFSPFVGHESLGSLRLGASHLFENRYFADTAASNETYMTGFDAMWDLGGLHFRSEYVRRAADNDTVNPAGNPAVIKGDGAGWYVEAGIDLAPWVFDVALPFSENKKFNLIRPFARYNRSDTPTTGGLLTAVPGEEIRRWDVGILVSPLPHLKFRLEVHKADEAGGNELDNDGALLNVTLDF